MNSRSFSDLVPQDDQVTDYDLAHLRTYLRLLDIDGNGGPAWREAARHIFGVDPVKEPGRARRLYDTHLARARWMMRHGYRKLAAFERLDPRFR